MDCEGAEYDILVEAPSVLAKIDRIIMEYHHIDGVKNHKQLISILEGEGFSVIGTPISCTMKLDTFMPSGSKGSDGLPVMGDSIESKQDWPTGVVSTRPVKYHISHWNVK